MNSQIFRSSLLVATTLFIVACGGQSNTNQESPNTTNDHYDQIDDDSARIEESNTDDSNNEISENAVDARYIVVLKDSSIDSSDSSDAEVKAKTSIVGESMEELALRLIEEASESTGAFLKNTPESQLGNVYQYAIAGFSARLSEEELTYLQNHDEVAYIEPVVHVATPQAVQSNPDWSLDILDQVDLPLNNTYSYNATGKGVHIYVIDSGIRSSHNEFTGRIGKGFSAIAGDAQNIEDDFGHGTAVASKAAGATLGLAKDAIIHPVKIAFTDNEEVITAVDWVVANHEKPAVVNTSISFSSFNGGAIYDALNNMVDEGIVHVTALRNSGLNIGPDKDLTTLSEPCSSDHAYSKYRTAIVVSGIDRNRNSTNYDTCADIYAPGWDVKMAGINSDSDTYIYYGNSFAAPMVTGAVALYLEDHPNASPAQVSEAIFGSALIGKVNNIINLNSPNLLLHVGDNKIPQSSFPITENFHKALTWVNVGDYEWIRHSGSTRSFKTGPTGGAENSSTYAYMETSSGYAYDPGNSAVLMSDWFRASSTTLSFFYHMYGVDIGSLYVEAINSQGNWQTLWSLSGQQFPAWQKFSIDIPGTHTTRVRIRAVAKGGYRGDIGIDNIEIKQGPIGLVKTYNNPTFQNYPIGWYSNTESDIRETADQFCKEEGWGGLSTTSPSRTTKQQDFYFYKQSWAKGSPPHWSASVYIITKLMCTR